MVLPIVLMGEIWRKAMPESLADLRRRLEKLKKDKAEQEKKLKEEREKQRLKEQIKRLSRKEPWHRQVARGRDRLRKRMGRVGDFFDSITTD